jgi:PiT family inorganic phosphate transporter
MSFAILIIILALIFDFYNGMNDAANSIATVVSTRVLSPFQAVLWAAFFNFAAAFLFGVHVANTIGKGIVDVAIVDNLVIFSGLIGAILLTATATHYGLPISVSHSIIGGFGGAAIAKAGLGSIIISGYTKVLIFIFIAPILAFSVAILFSIITLWLVRHKSPYKVDKYLGIIALVLFTNGLIGDTFYVPFGVMILSYSVISIGTLIGGWKVIRTLGMRVTKLTPFGGFSAETSSGLTISLASILGIPVSTTHTITGAIIGVGSIRSISAVRWGVAKNILWAWVLTIPLSALFAILTFYLSSYIITLFTG